MTPTEKALWLFSVIHTSVTVWLLIDRRDSADRTKAIYQAMSAWMKARGSINDTVDKDLARINKHIFK